MFSRIGAAASLTLGMLSAIPAIAGTVTISTGGTWGIVSGSDSYYASNQAWTLSYQVANPPGVASFTAGGFRTTYSNAVYTLNGSPIPVTGNAAQFFDSESLFICLDAPCQFEIESFPGSDKLFTGANSSPTFVPGIYHTDSSGFAGKDQGIGALNETTPGTILTITVTNSASAVPEPASCVLTFAGIITAGLYLRRR